ncbi:MAG: hypothetical protein P4L99_27710 [Chthoniobacter sp.]|nr:hypothetical protein [Chthoniobacter sp.]
MIFGERAARISVFVAELGAEGAVAEELLRYNQSEFVHDEHTRALRFPLADEPFVAAWERYLAEAAHAGVFPTLQRKLVQLAFPISQGVSTTEAYLAATRRGVWPAAAPESGLQLVAPEALEMQIYATPAGRLPILITRERADFETLLRALTKRNEPAAVPLSQGACMVAGYNNWDRIADLRRQWESGALADGSSSWDECFVRLQPRKELYQDRFILLSDGGYSGVTASSLGLDEPAWRGISLAIRRDHECTHYFTKRVFQSMRNLLLDEVIADFMGLRTAAKGYRADWFLRFMGLEGFPSYREGGRLQNYLGAPPLSTEAFRLVCLVVKRASEQLEIFDRNLPGDVESSAVLMALTGSSLLEFAMPEAPNMLAKSVKDFYGRRPTS